MTIVNIAIVVSAYALIAFLIFFLRQDKARISKEKIKILAVIAGVFFAVLYPFWERHFGNTVRMINLYITIEFYAVFPFSFWAFSGKRDKTLFFISMTLPFLAIGHGLGNLAEQSFASGQTVGRIFNFLIMTACFALIAGIIYLTRKKFSGLFTNENPKLWRRLWIITILMGLTQIVSGNIFLAGTFTPANIIPSRLISLAGMTAILYIAGLAKVQAEVSAAATARAEAAERAVLEKEKAYAAIVAQMEETSRFRHDTRQIYAAISGLNEARLTTELEKYCREVLEHIGDTENKTAIKSDSKTEDNASTVGDRKEALTV